MNHEQSKSLIETRDKLLLSIKNFFEETAIEGHIFGSLARNDGDTLSDIDIWFTFKDGEVGDVIEKRFEIYNRFGKVVICHEAQQNFPLGGKYSLVIYDTPAGLIQVDYFLCPQSSSRIIPNSKILFEKTPIEKGAMIYDPKRIKKDPGDKLNFVICMCFVGIKKVIRKDPDFLNFLISEYNDMRARMFPELSVVENDDSFNTIKNILKNCKS
ncbi:TPA: hypothetical protein DCQ44_00045, partial [Candidatus Taylorbacteria bacterium]|nr:hypothetical protein [Candidatus Taylorbacteria bacterium]